MAVIVGNSQVPSLPELCPRDDHSPLGAPCALANEETVLRAVRDAGDLVFDGLGAARLAPMSWSTADLRAKLENKTQIERCASVLRSITQAHICSYRLEKLTKTLDWKDDPVKGEASVAKLRSLKDGKARRMFCVFADPIDDALDQCPTHAGITKTKPHPIDPREQIDWLLIRTVLSDVFIVQHCSGNVVHNSLVS